METADILTIIGGIGGIQGFIELVKWWRGRKVHDRQDVADVVAAENENERKQVSWLEARLAERDKKIDDIYAELRAEQTARLEEVHRRHEVELKLAEVEVKKCHKRGCADRIPHSRKPAAESGRRGLFPHWPKIQRVLRLERTRLSLHYRGRRHDSTNVAGG